jgi:OmpA-OmpF porin, OOP family
VAFVNIEFESGKAVIRQEAIPLLDKIIEAMKKNPFLKLKIVGHTDDVGTDDANLKLSIERANAVLEKLVELGIGRERLSAEGFGESRPIVPNTDDANRKKNRRTEFIIIDK